MAVKVGYTERLTENAMTLSERKPKPVSLRDEVCSFVEKNRRTVTTTTTTTTGKEEMKQRTKTYEK